MTSRGKQISEDVLAILSSAEVHGSVVRLTCGTLDGKDGRKLYLAVDAALQALGGRWDRKHKGHVFPSDPSKLIEAAILSGQVQRPSDFDFFATPAPLAARMADYVGRIDRCCLEPSAGKGALIDALLERSPKAFVDAFEIDPGRADHLRSRYAPARVHVKQCDFLSVAPYPKTYQAVLMNPPFSDRGDVRHVLAAWAWLAPGGRMAAVLSAGAAFRQDKLSTSLRELVNANAGCLDELADDTFKDEGTRVRTVLLTMTKPRGRKP